MDQTPQSEKTSQVVRRSVLAKADYGMGFSQVRANHDLHEFINQVEYLH
jgi:hypothetical protein